jgi:hypothetical protein
MSDHAPALRLDGRGFARRFDLFTDEIAVDFPSMRAVAERMREAFLAGEAAAEPLVAEVRLTPAQAEDGRRVPVDLALRCTCRQCGGRGEVWGEACRDCRGTGHGTLSHQVHLYVPSGVRDGARFVFTVAPPHGLATHVHLRVTVA